MHLHIDLSDMLMHPNVQAEFEHLAQAFPHALLLSGVQGVGVHAVADRLVAGLLRISSENLEHPYLLMIKPEKGVITIESVRRIHDFLARKVPGREEIRRIVYISDAETITKPAQNALLKNVEEPPEDTVIILTSSNHQALLPTILSRVATIHVSQPDEEATVSYFEKQGYQTEEIRKAIARWGALPEVLQQKLANVGGDDEAMSRAKELLRADVYGRLLLINDLSKDRVRAVEICQCLIAISSAAMKSTAGTMETFKRWHAISKVSHEALSKLQHMTNVKLVLSELVMAL